MILTLVRVRPPREPDDELSTFCRSLRIISARDMDGTVTVVFRSMLVGGREKPVGSSELAERTHLNRVTIIHHLQRLEQMGLVEHTERKYRLRVSGLAGVVAQMREEMMRSFGEAEALAADLDREFLLAHDEAAQETPKPHTALISPALKTKAVRTRPKKSR